MIEILNWLQASRVRHRRHAYPVSRSLLKGRLAFPHYSPTCSHTLRRFQVIVNDEVRLVTANKVRKTVGCAITGDLGR